MSGEEWERYWKFGFPEMEGWLTDSVRWHLEAIAALHEERKVTGSILEIGVHHGRFFVPLALLSDPRRERCVAIDVFGMQDLNIDRSGSGAQAPFRANLDKYCRNRRVEIIEADSLALTVADRVRLVQEHGPVRIASIDGGHTAEHTVNDLNMVQDMCTGGAVVILDDYYNAHWPGVHEGVARFYLLGTPKLKPFACSANKTYFTDFSHHEPYFRRFAEKFHTVPGYKEVKMYGSAVAYF